MDFPTFKVHDLVLGAIRGANKNLEHLIVPVLKHKSIYFGRSNTCTVVLPAAFISKLHCRIYAKHVGAGKYVVCVEDLSENGTYLNGAVIGQYEHRVLYPGSVLHFCDPSLIFYFMRIGSSYGKWLKTTPMYLPDGTELVISNERIGEGTQSEVFLVGTPFKCSQQFVCKRTRPVRIFDSELEYHKKKLAMEVEVLKKLCHPNIISVIHAQENEDHTFSIISPLVLGGTLDALIKTSISKPLHAMETQFIMYQLLSATKYIHSNGIIHRDLKPDNVFVYANRVRLAHVVIGDFGVAINTNGEASWADHHGTKAYFAPEMLKDHTTTEKVDCWSLGMILYQLLTRQFPFSSSSEELSWPHIRQWILEGSVDFEPASDLPPSAISLVEHLLAKDPDHRWSAAEAFAAPYTQLDFSQGRLFEQYQHVIDSHLHRLSTNMVSPSLSSPSSTPRNPRNPCLTKAIKFGEDVSLPGDKRQQAGFTQGLKQAPQPRYFENGQRIV